MKEQIIYDQPQEQILKGEQAYFQSEPWPRFIARLMDTYVFSLVVGVIFTIFNSFIFDLLNIQASYGLTSIVILWIVAGVMFLIIEALLLSTVGTTPGKFLMGVRINKKIGQSITFSEAMKRTWSVWFRGLGLNIPLITLFTLISSYQHLSREGITSWDEKGQFVVVTEPMGTIRTLISVVFFLYIFFS